MRDMLGEFYYPFSSYNYCLNNPILYVDPFGLDVWSTSDPNAIAAFLRQIQTTGGATFGGNNWDYISDDEFLHSGDLSYSNKTESFYYTKGFYNDKETGIKSIEFPGLRGFPDNSLVDSDEGEIKAFDPNFWGGLYENYFSKNFVGRIGYRVFDDVYLYSTGLINGRNNAMHLNRSGVEGSEYTEAGMNSISTLVPIGSFGKWLGIQRKVLNAAQFSSTFKGQSVLKGSAQKRGAEILQYNHVVRTNNSFSAQFNYFTYGSLLFNDTND